MNSPISSGKVALITGITGQDGSYLAELLLSKGYKVHGLVRKASNFTTDRIEHLYNLLGSHQSTSNIELHYGDLQDFSSLMEIVSKSSPTEIYNLAAQSHVKVSFDLPNLTNNTVNQGFLNLLEVCRLLKSQARIYQASSSEMFGSTPPAQNENSRFDPQSPYAIAKLASHHLAKLYRDAYGMFVVSGILFNHESPRRHETFVTRKISKAAAEIYMGKRGSLVLGNLDARRDWGYAPEYVLAMWSMLQQSTPNDFVIATGESYSIRDFLDFTFGEIGLNWSKYVIQDKKFLRPREVDFLLGDASLAREILGWEAQVKAPELAKIMLKSDIDFIKNK